MKRLVLLLALVLPLTAHRAVAQRFFATGVSDRDVQSYFERLQRAVSANQRATVAAMVGYPLRVNYGPKRHTVIADRAELLRRYDAIFTPAIRRAIVTERFDAISSSSEGVAIGRGAVWLRGVCSRNRPISCHMAVWSINVPS